LPAKLDRIVDLILERFDRDFRIEKSGRPNDLFDNQWRSGIANLEFLGRLVCPRNMHLRLLERRSPSAVCPGSTI